MDTKEIKDIKESSCAEKIFDIVREEISRVGVKLSWRDFYFGLMGKTKTTVNPGKEENRFKKLMDDDAAIISDYQIGNLVVTSRTSWITDTIRKRIGNGNYNVNPILERIKKRLREFFSDTFLSLIDAGDYSVEQILAILIIHSKGNFISEKCITTDLYCKRQILGRY